MPISCSLSGKFQGAKGTECRYLILLHNALRSRPDNVFPTSPGNARGCVDVWNSDLPASNPLQNTNVSTSAFSRSMRCFEGIPGCFAYLALTLGTLSYLVGMGWPLTRPDNSVEYTLNPVVMRKFDCILGFSQRPTLLGLLNYSRTTYYYART